jgi:hypothetical protein
MREWEILREHGEEPCFFCDSAARALGALKRFFRGRAGEDAEVEIP